MPGSLFITAQMPLSKHGFSVASLFYVRSIQPLKYLNKYSLGGTYSMSYLLVPLLTLEEIYKSHFNWSHGKIKIHRTMK